MARASFIDKVQSFFDQHVLTSGKVVVAVSGGPDSLALLLALVKLRQHAASTIPGRFPGPLIIAHFNHRLRGAESDEDERFVAGLRHAMAASAAEDVRFESTAVDVAAVARSEGTNVEAVARRLRYRWLVEVSQKIGATLVATGHTADDQAETVLHRLLRGSGLKGLRGIAPRRSLAPGIDLIRPLLSVRRNEVIAFLGAEGQNYRRDSSNDDLRYTRNRIRHVLLPALLESYNPAIVAVLCRLAEQARTGYRQQAARARRLWREIELPRAGSLVIIDGSRLTGQPRHVLCEAFRLLWFREGWPMNAMGFRHWERLADVAICGLTAVDLPGRIRARRRGRVVQIGPAS